MNELVLEKQSFFLACQLLSWRIKRGLAILVGRIGFGSSGVVEWNWNFLSIGLHINVEYSEIDWN